MKTQQQEVNSVSGELESQSTYEDDIRSYMSKKYDYIPLSPKLIEHVRRLDSLNVSVFAYFLICLSMSKFDTIFHSTMNFRF